MWTFFVDSDMDFTPEVASSYGYKLISMPYSIDAKTIYPYEDFKQFDSASYYAALRSGVIPTTSAISEAKYIEYFEPEFAAGNDILYMHFSEAMTMTFGNMRKALDTLKSKYPDRRFLEIDTKGITIISYLIARDASKLLKSGKTPDEVVEWAGREVPCYRQYFFADDLKFFRRSGRVSGIAATMGGLIGVRPIVHMSSEGKMVSIGTEKGRVKAIERLLSFVDEYGDDIKSHGVIIGHTDSPDIVREISDRLKSKYGEDLDVTILITNPTSGAHCGPNGVGIAFHSLPRLD